MIIQHPAVADTAVTSTWDDTEATEIPCAFIVPRTKGLLIDRDELIKSIQTMVGSKVAGYKKLRGGVYFVDSLPRNPTGKLLRRELRKIAEHRARI